MLDLIVVVRHVILFFYFPNVLLWWQSAVNKRKKEKSWVPIRFPRRKPEKLSGNWLIQVSGNTRDESFMVEICHAPAREFLFFGFVLPSA
jgi:hypothetical protein